MRLVRRAAALLMAGAMFAGVLAVASPASAADTPRPDMTVAQLRQLMESGSVNVIDLTGVGTFASMVERNGDFPKGKVYRNGSWGPPRALERLTGFTEFIMCDTLGSQIWTVVQNPNDVPAPFDFAVSSATWVGYGGRQYAAPGWNIIISIQSPDTYHFTVGWDDQRLTFFDDDLTVTCPSPPVPEWPPTS